MQIEFLTTIPISGSVPEYPFDAAGRRNAWVRFDDGEGGDWVGVFGADDLSPFTTVLPFADDGGRTVLVIAGGRGYVVDVEARALVRRATWEGAYAAAAVPGRDFVLVADTIHIWATGRDRDVAAERAERHPYDGPDWGGLRRSARVALDGIVFDAPGPDGATGCTWEPDGWHAFRLDYADMTVRPGRLVATEWEAVTADPARGGFAAGRTPPQLGALLI